MTESYDIGTKLLPEDFSDSYYMPIGAYQYAEVAEINGDQVQLIYVNSIGSTSDAVWVSKDQLARMLGWEEDPLIGADDDELAEYELEVVVDEAVTDEISDEELLNTIQTAPTVEEKDNLELLDTEEDEPGMYVEVKEGAAIRAYIFATKQAAQEAFNRVVR